MRHTLQAEGFGVRLRPVTPDDAAFIVWLRNLDYVKGRVGDSAVDIQSQQAWLAAYFTREGDYYFIVETPGGVPVGTYGIYGVSGGSGESGRWIIRPGVPAAVPSGVVLLDTAFHRLSLREVHGSTVASNQSVLSINRKFGFRRTGIQPGAQIIGGKAVDLVNFSMTAEEWPKARERLMPLVRLAETQVLQWERENLKTDLCRGAE
jgi:RimJ/RimL family protein N-acetyltransferase